MAITTVRYVFLLIVAALSISVTVEGQEINFCSLSLPKGILQANTSFNAVYEFDVDKDGVPLNVKPVERKSTNPQEVQACLQQWRLPESALKHLVAVFEWRHGVGWTKLAISGPALKLTIHLSGERCPYCAAGGPVADGLSTSR
jgi:hypothetical protein